MSLPAEPENGNAPDESVLPALAAQDTQPNGPFAPNETTPETPGPAPVKPAADTPAAVVDSSSNAKPDVETLPPRLPIPDEASRQAALKTVLATFDADFKAARASKTFDPKTALVGTLRSAAEAGGNEPATNYVLLQRARELAVEMSDVDLAMELIDELAARFKIDELGMKAESLSACAAGTRNPAILLKAYRRGSDLTHPAIEDDKFDVALALVDAASRAASKARNRNQVKALAKQRREIIGLRGKFKKAQTAAETLEDEPDDEAANLMLGTYLCAIKNDWPAAAPYLSKCDVPDLQEAASLELTNPSEPTAQAELGDKWWAAAQRKRGDEQAAYQSRASHWYRKGHRNLTGLEKVKVAGRLRQLNEITNKRTLRPGLLVRQYNPLKSQQQGEPLLNGTEKLGDPLGEPKVITSIDTWRFDAQYNATATGFLRIDEPGRYSFESNGFYDRNLLFLNGKLVLKYQQKTRFVVELDIGMHPIVSVGTPGARGYVIVTWMPPGKSTLEPIPPELLFHKPPVP